MPQINRDKETLYPPGRLNLWFLVTSAALVGAIVWMLAGDFSRPWKKVQRDFFARQAGLLDIKRDLAERELYTPALRDDKEAQKEAQKVLDELRELRAQIALAERALNEKGKQEEKARLEAEITEQEARRLETDTRIKAVKGSYAERKYAYDMALKERHAEKAAEIADRIDELASELKAEENKQRSALVAKERAMAALDAMHAELRGLEKRRDRIVAKIEKAATEAGAVRRLVDKNQWRNLPMADIVNPSIRIEKVVLADIHDNMVFATSPKVDMCMTCHLGADKPIMSEDGDSTTIGVRGLLTGFLRMRMGEKVWKEVESNDILRDGLAKRIAPGQLRTWLTSGRAVLFTEPRPASKQVEVKDLSEPLFDKAALEDAFKKAAVRDGLTKEQSDEAGRRTFREVVGGKDLLAAFRIEPVQWAHPHLGFMVGSQTKHPLSKMGCTVCHAGVGRRLDFARATHAPVSAEQKAEWIDKHDWEPPHYVDFPMLPLTYAQGQCVKCHMEGVPHPIVIEHLVQPLVKQNPDDENEVGKRPTAPKPRKPSEREGWHPDVLETGVDRIREYGCMGCHVIKGFGTTPGFAPEGWSKEYVGSTTGDPSQPPRGALTSLGQPKVAPPLTHLADKTTEAFVYRWISNPNRYRPDTRMPSFYRQAQRDERYRLVMGPDGKPIDETVVVNPGNRDEVQIEVEQLAITKALFANFSKQKVKSRAADYPDVPAGDPKKGAELFYSGGNCFACHVGPGRFGADGQLVPDSLDRFLDATGDLPPGPRLTAMGSKVNAKWLYAWLADPRHYNAVSRMPYNRFKDQLAADGKTVVRTADQLRADLVAYLMGFKDAAFDAIEVGKAEGPGWTAEHKELLEDFWLEWMGKRDPTDPTKGITDDAVRAYYEKQPLEQVLVDVGQRLLGFRGCFGCHDVSGYEDAQPVGKELTREGSQDIHQFDFGILGKDEVEKNRWSWIEKKLEEPRIFDKGRFKPLWGEKLRMPKFNFNASERTAVTAVVLGLVEEPIKPGARPAPSRTRDAILAGRAVVARYGCNNCHTIEGKEGYAYGDQVARGIEGAFLPPNLYGQGNRTRADWLFKFLKEPHDLRPQAVQRMPQFRLSDEEASALVDYFMALSGRKDRIWSDPEDGPLDDTPYPKPVTVDVKGVPVTVNSLREEAKAIFEAFNCAKCHLAKGTFGADPEEGGVAPPFTLSGPRLRRDWVEELLINPQNQINGTKMVQFWPGKARRGKPLPPPDSINVQYPQLPAGARFKEGATNDDVAVAQMKAVTRYLLYHYEPPKPPNAPPSPADANGPGGK